VPFEFDHQVNYIAIRGIGFASAISFGSESRSSIVKAYDNRVALLLENMVASRRNCDPENTQKLIVEHQLWDLLRSLGDRKQYENKDESKDTQGEPRR
jgi:hypothetical protein